MKKLFSAKTNSGKFVIDEILKSDYPEGIIDYLFENENKYKIMEALFQNNETIEYAINSGLSMYFIDFLIEGSQRKNKGLQEYVNYRAQLYKERFNGYQQKDQLINDNFSKQLVVSFSL